MSKKASVYAVSEAEQQARDQEQTVAQEMPVHAEVALRSYAAPWKGELLLACAKCQKKLRRHNPHHPLARLRKFLKHATRDRVGAKLHVIDAPCLKLCPKGGVTICTQAQLAQHQCSILRTPEQAAHLYTLRIPQAETQW